MALLGRKPAQMRSSWDAALLWVLVLFITMQTTYVVYYIQFLQLPEPVPAALASNSSFSEELAYQHLEALTSLGPHPVPSPVFQEALEYILMEAKAIEEEAASAVHVDIDVFNVGAGVNDQAKWKSIVYANTQQLVVRVTPANVTKAEENAILVSAHVDTVVTGPGAGDDTTAIAVMLELLRVVSHWENGFKNAVIFIFNAGEEEGLLGSHAFITQHPWRSSVRTFINLDAMGVGGKCVLFQVGPNNIFIEAYSKVAKYPTAQITAQDVFHSGIVKSSTDYQIYTEYGHLSGLDFAFMKRGAVYHTKNDKLPNVTPGSLQHTGENTLALLQELANSDDLQTSSVGSSDGIVYFDILGKFMITYCENFAKRLYTFVIAVTLLVLVVSIYQGGSASVKALMLATISLIFTWVLAISFSVLSVFLLPQFSEVTIPYLPYPWLVIGLFGAPALCGALLGNFWGFSMLKGYLLRVRKTSSAVHIKSSEHSDLTLAVWDAQRWLFKAGFLQWLVILAVGTWLEVGSTYIALLWLISPALAYVLMDATFSSQRTLSELRVNTLFGALAVPLVTTGGVIILLFDVLIGNLARLDRNPGSNPDWLGNIIIAALTAIIVCLFFVYLLPYAHESGAIKWILSGLGVVFIITLGVVSSGILPPFTSEISRVINVVHVFENGTMDEGQSSFSSYVLLYAGTPGNLRQEAYFLEDEQYNCGEFEAVDLISHNIKYGCTSFDIQENQTSYVMEFPTMVVSNETVVDDERATSVLMDAKESRRWVLAMYTTEVHSYELAALNATTGEKRILASRTIEDDDDGRHLVQFMTNSTGPSQFELTLFSSTASLENTGNPKEGAESLLVKWRVDVDKTTEKVERTLEKLPNWDALFGKSTGPYRLAYLVNLPRTTHCQV